MNNKSRIIRTGCKRITAWSCRWCVWRREMIWVGGRESLVILDGEQEMLGVVDGGWEGSVSISEY